MSVADTTRDEDRRLIGRALGVAEAPTQRRGTIERKAIEVSELASSTNTVDLYLEVGRKRTFAGAIDWPGWCRSGRDERSALEALVHHGSRYARVLQATRLGFRTPLDTAAFNVVERLEGNGTTDFGAPDAAPSSDSLPIDSAELRRLQEVLAACWQAFDDVVRAARGKELRKGPRGGGRDLEEIVDHVLGAERAYLSRLAWKLAASETPDSREELIRTRQAVLVALAAKTRGDLPTRGPRGGLTWSPRYFVRRVAWHVLDHLWEIEDRVV